MAHAIDLLPLLAASTTIGVGLGLLWCRRKLGSNKKMIAFLTNYLNNCYQLLAKTVARMPKGRETE